MLALSSDHYRVDLLRDFLVESSESRLDSNIKTAISYLDSDHYKYQIYSFLINHIDNKNHPIAALFLCVMIIKVVHSLSSSSSSSS